MKIQKLFLIGLILLPLLSAQAQFGQTNPLINVSGSSEVKVAPDEVDLNVSVESRDASLEIAKSQNDQSVAKALEFLKHSGIKEKDVQTDYISVEPVYRDNNYSYESQTRPVYYRVSKGIEIRLANVREFETILTGLITNGVNRIQGIDFKTTELRKYKDQARSMAIRAAKEKADAMAAELGVKVGKPYAINVEETGGTLNWWRGYGYGGGNGFNSYQNSVANAGGSGGDAGSFASGQISVTATVTVSFLIQ